MTTWLIQNSPTPCSVPYLWRKNVKQDLKVVSVVFFKRLPKARSILGLCLLLYQSWGGGSSTQWIDFLKSRFSQEKNKTTRQKDDKTTTQKDDKATRWWRKLKAYEAACSCPYPKNSIALFELEAWVLWLSNLHAPMYAWECWDGIWWHITWVFLDIS